MANIHPNPGKHTPSPTLQLDLVVLPPPATLVRVLLLVLDTALGTGNSPLKLKEISGTPNLETGQNSTYLSRVRILPGQEGKNMAETPLHQRFFIRRFQSCQPAVDETFINRRKSTVVCTWYVFAAEKVYCLIKMVPIPDSLGTRNL